MLKIVRIRKITNKKASKDAKRINQRKRNKKSFSPVKKYLSQQISSLYNGEIGHWMSVNVIQVIKIEKQPRRGRAYWNELQKTG